MALLCDCVVKHEMLKALCYPDFFFLVVFLV